MPLIWMMWVLSATNWVSLYWSKPYVFAKRKYMNSWKPATIPRIWIRRNDKRATMSSLNPDLNDLGFGVGNHAWCVSSSHYIASFLAECLSNLIAQVVSLQLLSSRPCLNAFFLHYDVKFPNDGPLPEPSSVFRGSTERQEYRYNVHLGAYWYATVSVHQQCNYLYTFHSSVIF